MNLRRLAEAQATQRALLRAASWLVPRRSRAEWLAEWRAELWHIVHERQLFAAASEAPPEDPVAFCLGAFPDALWLRRNTPSTGDSFQCDSARHCWLWLAAASVLATLLTVILAGPHSAMLRGAYLNSNSVVQIIPEGVYNTSTPSIPFADYNAWTHRTQRLFSGFAFYTQTSGSVEQLGHSFRTLNIAIASAGFFDLLQVPLLYSNFAAARTAGQPAVVLSQATWRRDFGSNPYIIGDPILIAGHSAVIAGIVAENAWSFPSRTSDAWLLDDATLGKLNPATQGVVLATLDREALKNNPEIGSTRWHMEVPVHPQQVQAPPPVNCIKMPSWYLPCRMPGDTDGFDCVSLADTVERPSSVFLFMLVLAVLALPATIPLSFGDAPVVAESLFAATRWRRWGFLLAKLAAIIPLVYFGSLLLAYTHTFSLANAEYIQLASSFAGCLILFRWTLHDQRKRCPVCLRLLTNPVRVGEPSRYFLAWSGTEMICSSGHGLLHTAELPTSWAGPRRWLHLDASWKPLFTTDAFTTLPS